jgi:hypothetical protein
MSDGNWMMNDMMVARWVESNLVYHWRSAMEPTRRGRVHQTQSINNGSETNNAMNYNMIRSWIT